MTDGQLKIYYVSFLGTALVILPIAYVSLCGWMLYRRAHWFSYLAQFFLFGTVGGWALTLGVSPSPFAAVFSIFMLITSPVCLVSSIFLQFRNDRNRFDNIAMVGGYSYTALFVIGIFAGLFFSSASSGHSSL